MWCKGEEESGLLPLNFSSGFCPYVGVGILSCNEEGDDITLLGLGSLTHAPPCYHEQIIFVQFSLYKGVWSFSHVSNLTIFIFIFISPSRWGSTIGTYVITNWGSKGLGSLAWLVQDSQIPRMCICFDKTIIFLRKGMVIVHANQELKQKPSSR